MPYSNCYTVRYGTLLYLSNFKRLLHLSNLYNWHQVVTHHKFPSSYRAHLHYYSTGQPLVPSTIKAVRLCIRRPIFWDNFWRFVGHLVLQHSLFCSLLLSFGYLYGGTTSPLHAKYWPMLVFLYACTANLANYNGQGLLYYLLSLHVPVYNFNYYDGSNW